MRKYLIYRILFTERALKDLENIDKETQIRFAQKLKEYAKLSKQKRAGKKSLPLRIFSKMMLST